MVTSSTQLRWQFSAHDDHPVSSGLLQGFFSRLSLIMRPRQRDKAPRMPQSVACLYKEIQHGKLRDSRNSRRLASRSGRWLTRHETHRPPCLCSVTCASMCKYQSAKCRNWSSSRSGIQLIGRAKRDFPVACSNRVEQEAGLVCVQRVGVPWRRRRGWPRREQEQSGQPSVMINAQSFCKCWISGLRFPPYRPCLLHPPSFLPSSSRTSLFLAV